MRWTRTLSALAALALAASVLAAASPAHGAAAEVSTRRLAGDTRYETALKIAEAYANQAARSSGRSGIDAAIVTSGDDRHFAYALPTPALARRHNAPVLLTPPDELHAEVSKFLARHGVSNVYIVGGTGVVSRSVERQIDALAGVAVTRIAGADAYDTAAELAALVGTSPGVPGTFPNHGRTALLATGEAFADALAAGPLAYRGQHPILLTRRSALPAAVEQFLTRSRTEHVVILGGTAAVSTTVQRDLDRRNINVTRWQGADRFATATQIARELLGLDAPQRCFDSSEIGLAYGWRSPDAIVSGPLLGELCAPLLLSELNDLPAGVEQFLESDDFVRGGSSGELRFTVFGGTAAVGEAAVAEAADAAALESLGATISAVEGGCGFDVTFSAPVLEADAANIANYLYGNAAFSTGDATVEAGAGRNTSRATVTLANGRIESDTSVATGCSRPLAARDRIGVVGGRINSATDRRRVGRVEFFVADDATAPTLTVHASEGTVITWVESSEPLRAGDMRVVFQRGTATAVPITVSVPGGATTFSLAAVNAFGDALRIGDKISIAAGDVRDLAGNQNRSVSLTVAKDTSPPRVSRISVTDPAPVGRASAELRARFGDGSAEPALRIEANQGEAADGAAGNEWSVELRAISLRRNGWSAAQRMSVSMSAATKRIYIEALTGTANAADSARVADVVAGLNANSAFRRLFTATEVGGRGADAPVSSGGGVAFAGGASTVDLSLRWNEPVKDCNDSQTPTRPRLVELDTDADGELDLALDGVVYGGSDVTFIAGARGTSNNQVIYQQGAATCDTLRADSRPGTLVARLRSAKLANLPSVRSLAEIRPGAATDLSGNRNTRQSGVPLSRD